MHTKKLTIVVLLSLVTGYFLGTMFVDSDRKPQHVHDHRGEDRVQVAEGFADPEVSLNIMKDPKSGYNLQISTKNFTFAPQNASLEHKDGEGHAHIYVDGEKVARIYSEWVHLDDLEEGERTIEVTLNANDHREYQDRFGVPVVPKQVIKVGDAMKSMGHDAMMME